VVFRIGHDLTATALEADEGIESDGLSWLVDLTNYGAVGRAESRRAGPQ
jgi:hypothetical protein